MKMIFFLFLILFQFTYVYQKDISKIAPSDYVGTYCLKGQSYKEFRPFVQFDIIEGRSAIKYSDLRLEFYDFQDAIIHGKSQVRTFYCKSFFISKDSLRFDTKMLMKSRYVFSGVFISPPRRTRETMPTLKGVLESHVGGRLIKKMDVQYYYTVGC
jgi:hypothetical protein